MARASDADKRKPIANKEKPRDKKRENPRTGGRQAKGRLAGKAKRSFFLRWLHGVRQAVLLFIAATVALTLLFRFVKPPGTPLMLIRLGEQWLNREPMQMRKQWQPLENMAPAVAQAVIASEDQNFFAHHGFDIHALMSAVQGNITGRRMAGASTITQQTAKNLFLWPERSWARKALEAYFTVLLELLWSKRRILEVYLNIAETGPGVYGFPMASKVYYRSSANQMTAEQAALLAACLPNPLSWNPQQPPRHALRRQAWILRQMSMRGSLPL